MTLLLCILKFFLEIFQKIVLPDSAKIFLTDCINLNKLNRLFKNKVLNDIMYKYCLVIIF